MTHQEIPARAPRATNDGYLLDFVLKLRRKVHFAQNGSGVDELVLFSSVLCVVENCRNQTDKTALNGLMSPLVELIQVILEYRE